MGIGVLKGERQSQFPKLQDASLFLKFLPLWRKGSLSLGLSIQFLQEGTLEAEEGVGEQQRTASSVRSP